MSDVVQFGLTYVYRLVDNDTQKSVAGWNRSNDFYTSLGQARNARTQLKMSWSSRPRDLRIVRALLGEWEDDPSEIPATEAG